MNAHCRYHPAKSAQDSRNPSTKNLEATPAFSQHFPTMSGHAVVRHDASAAANASSAANSKAGDSDFGFDAEVAADLADHNSAASAPSPPIAVPTSKAGKMNLAVQVAYEPPEFRTVSPSVDPCHIEEGSTDSPIGGGLMYAP